MTNDCAVYVAGADGWDFIKVGVTRNGDGRLANLQTGCPIEIRILSIRHGLSAEHAADLETAIHLLLADRHSKGEWFKVGLTEVRDILLRFKLAPKPPKRKLTGIEQTANARRVAFIKGTCGGRPSKPLPADREEEFRTLWSIKANSKRFVAKRFETTTRVVDRWAAERGLPAK